jgi:hypothetical protein
MDITSPADKYAEVSDLQVDNLHLLCLDFSISEQPTLNAWGSPLLTATHPHSPTIQTTVISKLVVKVKLLESKLVLQTTIIENNKNCKLIYIPLSCTQTSFLFQRALVVPTLSFDIAILVCSSERSNRGFTFVSSGRESKQRVTNRFLLLLQEHNLKSWIQKTSWNNHQDQIPGKSETNNDHVHQINDCIDGFKNNISTQVAPLNEGVQVGGFVGLNQQTVLWCLYQNQYQYQDHNQPMQTHPRHLPEQAQNHPAVRMENPPWYLARASSKSSGSSNRNSPWYLASYSLTSTTRRPWYSSNTVPRGVQSPAFNEAFRPRPCFDPQGWHKISSCERAKNDWSSSYRTGTAREHPT